MVTFLHLKQKVPKKFHHFRACLHVLSPCQSKSTWKFNIVSVEMEGQIGFGNPFCPSVWIWRWLWSKNLDIQAKPKKWQFLSPPIVHSLEGGAPSELLWTIHILSMQLYNFSYRFAQNWSFFKFFLNPINFDLKFHLKMVLEWSKHSFMV